MARTQTNGFTTTKKNQSSYQNGSNSTNTKNGSAKSTGSTQKTLKDVFEEGLKSIYSAEQQLIEALPEVAKAADNEELQDTINDHLQETKRHAERLEKIFERLQIDKNEVEKCHIMESLIEAGRKKIEEMEMGPVRDSVLIIGAQKIEHHEIAAYGSLCELADVLGYSKIMEILDRTLQEEGDADKKLSDIAKEVNDEAYEMNENAQSEFNNV